MLHNQDREERLFLVINNKIQKSLKLKEEKLRETPSKRKKETEIFLL
jgi:hypothetical protein